MKKVLLVALVFALFVSSSLADTSRYFDEETGVSFDAPVGWVELPNYVEDDAIKIQYIPGEKVGNVSIAFAVIDFYSAMSMAQYGYSRKKIDYSYLDDELVKAILGILEEKSDEEKRYGDFQYRIIDTSISQTEAGLTLNFDSKMALTLVNGYVLLFQYIAMSNSDDYYPVFEDVLSSVQMK